MAIMETRVENGAVRGAYGNDSGIAVYRGIPFAAPPVGDLRWRAPQPAKNWDGVLDASVFSPIPMQRRVAEDNFYRREFYHADLPASEDCLYLNVWTPAKSREERLPVALWIYGGGFVQGYANKLEVDGEAFAKRGIVFVSLNYRLGVFGFLAHPALTAEDANRSSGNCGILDQIAGLKWVRKNIAAFGGDPEKITIMGQSAGAMSVQAILASPLARGDVKRAVMESGGGYGGLLRANRSYDLQRAEAEGERFFRFCGLPNLAAARQVPAEELLEKYAAYQASGEQQCPWFPNADGYVLPASIFDSVAQDALADVDCLIGSTSNEASAYPKPKTIPSPEEFLRQKKEEWGDEAEEICRTLHLDSKKAIADYLSNEFTYRMQSSALAWCRKRDAMGKKPSYLYRFARNIPGHEAGGAFHSSEHMYIFQTFLRGWRPYQGPDFDLSRTMCAYWCNFVKFGDVNGDGLPLWRPYTAETPQTMKLNTFCICEELTESPAVEALTKLALDT